MCTENPIYTVCQKIHIFKKYQQSQCHCRKNPDHKPVMSSIAYQCVLLRVSEDQDIEAAKKLLEENADPAKWICVEAESVVVENVGDVILFIMADKDVADAAKEAFLALKK